MSLLAHLTHEPYSPEDIQIIQRKFLSYPSVAVVGASKDQKKYGTRVLKWYKERNIAATPVHPKEAELEDIKTLSSITELPSPTVTAVHIITPPKVTLGILKDAKKLGTPALWLQPGAEDQEVLEYIKNNDLSDRVIHSGPCILVQGDNIREQLKWTRLKATSTPSL